LQRLYKKLYNNFEIVFSNRNQETLAKDKYNIEETNPDISLTNNNITSKARLLEKKIISKLLYITIVDNFQGKEAKVVIILLIRNNQSSKIGFLKINNRINILLSRA